jgi:hypothetical protein
LDTEKEKGSDAALLYLPVFDAQSTLLQCSAVIGVTALLALLGRFLPKLRAALLRPFFLSGSLFTVFLSGKLILQLLRTSKVLARVPRMLPRFPICNQTPFTVTLKSVA